MNRALMLAACVFLVFCGAAGAQSSAASSPHTSRVVPALKHPQPVTTPASDAARTSASAAKISPLQDNADKLVDLAQQLKTAVDKSNEDTLSIDMLRRAEEIDKLAKHLEKQLHSTGR